jgi:hypothetical protein
MFGHLKAEEFVNVLEGLTPPGKYTKVQAHLQSCARCAETLASVRAMHAQMSEAANEPDKYIPEPDWADFRDGVRNALLSRSVKRETNHGWLNWANSSWRPVLAWGMSAMFIVALTTGMLVWNRGGVESITPDVDTVPDLTATADWAETDVLQQIAELDSEEAANLRLLLNDAVSELQEDVK